MMRIAWRFSSFAAFVSCAVFLFSSAAFSQIPSPRYRFLEVVDFAGKPVAGAAVGASKTNEQGRLENGVRVGDGDCPAGCFSIAKPGYFPFVDYFGLTRYDQSEPLVIELLVVPRTRAERQIVGREQEKRELFAAARTGDAALARKLLQTGLDPNLTTTDLRGVPVARDVPVVVYAATSGDGETVAEFLRAGALVSRNDAPTRRILITYLNADPLARHYTDAETEKAERRKAFETGAENLIKAGANVNPAEPGEQTPLMIAAAKGYFRTAELLIAKGVPVNAKDVYGMTALTYAVNDSRLSKTRYAMMNLLLRSGADINAATNDKGKYYGCETALKYAVRNGDLAAVKLLVENKAKTSAACAGSQTPLELAKSMLAGVYADKVREIIKLLEAAGAK